MTLTAGMIFTVLMVIALVWVAIGAILFANFMVGFGGKGAWPAAWGPIAIAILALFGIYVLCGGPVPTIVWSK